jgi:hypothetical protein
VSTSLSDRALQRRGAPRTARLSCPSCGCFARMHEVASADGDASVTYCAFRRTYLVGLGYVNCGDVVTCDCGRPLIVRGEGHGQRLEVFNALGLVQDFESAQEEKK